MLLPHVYISPIPPVESLLANLSARPIGPTATGGRITDISVYESSPKIFLASAAEGGVWKTENAGASFACIFDKEGTGSVGSVAIGQSDPNLIWVGAGDPSNRNDCGWGDGIYKSTDGGKSWQNMGLRNTFAFSRIVIDPKNPNVVLAATLGSPWAYGEERGLFRTADGGKTWKRVLYVDDKSGAADLAMDPKDHRRLLCAMWEHLRRPYSFTSGGPGCGVFRSTDNGLHWHKVKGMPTPMGRVGLSYFRKDPRIVIATVEENDPRRTKGWPIGGSNLYRSIDGGESWTKMPSLVEDSQNQATNVPVDTRPFYFSLPRQDPADVNRIYVGSVDVDFSEDKGKVFHSSAWAIHPDQHAMWIDPSDTAHIIVGGDGGLAQTRDRGLTWDYLTSFAIGQFWRASYDMRKPYWVYGGMQDNGAWAIPTQGVHECLTGEEAVNLGGGDGCGVQVDPSNWTTCYVEFQGGRIMRIDQKQNEWKDLDPLLPQVTARPAGALPGRDVRRNWCTPFLISHWNSDTIYYGGSKLYKSMDRGDYWTCISPDLTKNDQRWQQQPPGITPDRSGAETYDTIVTISESPLRQGMIWAGTDDGNLQLTQDDGAHWTDLTSKLPELPPNTWVSRVVASRFEQGRAYAVFDGHRSNDFKPHAFVTEDYGQTWKQLSQSLPYDEPCYVIAEGTKNPSLLFLGTERSLYISFDRGQNWTRFQGNGFPTVPIYDLEIQPREDDLIIATHGRSIYILPIAALDELTPENLKEDVHFARPSNVYYFGRTVPFWFTTPKWRSSNTQPGTLFCYYLRQDVPVGGTLQIHGPSGEHPVTFLVYPYYRRKLPVPGKAGLNVVSWRADPRETPAGDYRVTLTIGRKQYNQTLHIENVADEQDASAAQTENR